MSEKPEEESDKPSEGSSKTGGYEFGADSPKVAAKRFVEMAFGELDLERKAGVPVVTENSLEGHGRVTVVAMNKVIAKARVYREANGNVGAVWPL